MDRSKETAIVVKAINQYKTGKVADFELVKIVCNYFDMIKAEKLREADMRFLKYISNIAGVPHYYDLLQNLKLNEQSDIYNYDLLTFSSMFYESTLHTSEKTKIHKYQSKVLNLFKSNQLNRFFLSASTSFGKTYLIYEVINKLNYNNIALIFPTIALLSENLEKIILNPEYNKFKEIYKIHTLSEIKEIGEKNIFIYTPERFLSFLETSKPHLKFDFDFVFVDEVYKIDNDYIIDETVKENERDIAYRIAIHYSIANNTDILLAGPYIEFSDKLNLDLNQSFNEFIRVNGITVLDFNNYEIVDKTIKEIKSAKLAVVDDDLSFEFSSNQKTRRLTEIIKELNKINENSIIYCSTKSATEKYAKQIIDEQIFNSPNDIHFNSFINHVERNYGTDWVIVKALKNSIGVHHGLVPKYIQKEIINFFNQGLLKVLISTTTITEGVNTSAKNMIVLHSKKGNKPLKKFDAKNIAGRAGRFMSHFTGRVISLQNSFLEIINSDADYLKHKNYDKNSPKDEIDLFYSQDDYLTNADKIRKNNVLKEQAEREIPDEIIERFKVVSRIDKIAIFDAIKDLSLAQIKLLNKLISKINYSLSIDFESFQIIIDIIKPIVKNKKLEFLFEHKKVSIYDNNEYSIFIYLLYFYLKDGFNGSLKYKVSNQNKSKDIAMRETAEFVYNTLKYQAVKYLGVFNLMFRYYKSIIKGTSFDEEAGIDKLLMKLEYNALTNEGRIASDFGVPYNIVEYYENDESKSIIKEQFDIYEQQIFDKVSSMFDKE